MDAQARRMRAFTRKVSSRLAECELTHLPRSLIDAVEAARQHASYEEALMGAGFEIVRLPDLADDPDAVFVEDTALLLDDHAVITRPGAPSRIGETESTAAGLESYFSLHHMKRGYLDGGDVLRIGRSLYVGHSSRTDSEGISELRVIASSIEFKVVEAALRDCLHLKTGATFVGLDTSGTPVLLFNERCVDPAQFTGVEPMRVDPHEPDAANCVRAGSHLILPAGNPRTSDRLRKRGFTVIEVDVSELQKAEAGVTCMSLVDERR
jgi:dimethylargininase